MLIMYLILSTLKLRPLALQLILLDLYLGKGSVIALGAGAHKDNGSIVFDFKDAAVFAEQGGKVILESDSYLKGDRNVVVFQDADNNGANILRYCWASMISVLRPLTA